MAREIEAAMDGLRDILSGISSIEQVRYWPMEPIGQSDLVIQFMNDDPEMTLGGSSFTGLARAILYVHSGLAEEAMRTIWRAISPLGPESIEAAIDSDNSWRGSVDDGRLVRPIPAARLVVTESGGMYIAQEFNFRFLKYVST